VKKPRRSLSAPRNHSRTTSKNKVLIWTYKKGHESAQRFNKTFKKHSYYAYIAQVGSSIWGGKRKERLFETTGGKKGNYQECVSEDKDG